MYVQHVCFSCSRATILSILNKYKMTFVHFSDSEETLSRGKPKVFFSTD
uniref:Uncharacterized protein n=1 Tax=Anguilla anguilla TaxID=7936 RepID=A0A0E9U4M4_ANGAN